MAGTFSSRATCFCNPVGPIFPQVSSMQRSTESPHSGCTYCVQGRTCYPRIWPGSEPPITRESLRGIARAATSHSCLKGT